MGITLAFKGLKCPLKCPLTLILLTWRIWYITQKTYTFSHPNGKVFKTQSVPRCKQNTNQIDCRKACHIIFIDHKIRPMTFSAPF